MVRDMLPFLIVGRCYHFDKEDVNIFDEEMLPFLQWGDVTIFDGGDVTF